MTIEYQTSGICSRVIECGDKGISCLGQLVRALGQVLVFKAS